MRAGLVRHHVNHNAAPHNLRQHIGTIAHQANTQRTAFTPRRFTQRQRLVQVFAQHVAIACGNTALNARAIHVDGQHDSVV